MEGFAAAVQASDVAVLLRQSRWTYPAVNTLHVLGVALLFGAIAPMDLRLIGLWRGDMPVRGVVRLLRPVAAFGAALAVVTGALLFAVQASDYVGLPLFFAKMGLVGLGLIHALTNPGIADASRSRQRRAGALSVAVWTGALACGRILGYV